MSTEAKTNDTPVAIEDADNSPPMVDIETMEQSPSTPESKEVVTMESLRKLLKASCFEPASNAAGQVNGNEDDDERLFPDSTHSFFIYYETETTEKVSKLIISVFVILVQISLFITICQGPLDDLSSEKFLIPVKVAFGKKCDEDTKNLVCPPEVANVGYCGMAALLLSFFLMHDLVASIRIFIKVPGRISKIAATAILVETMLALFCGGLFAVAAHEGYEAIANCIGVLFIHDMADKAFKAYEVLKLHELARCHAKRCKCLGKTRLASLFIVSISVIFVVLMAGLMSSELRKYQVIDQYGSDYWNKKFDDGGFSYGWDLNYQYVYGEGDAVGDGSEGGDESNM